MVSDTYKHLEAKLKLGDFTIGQWAIVALGVLAAVVWGGYLCPWGGFARIWSTSWILTIPGGAAFVTAYSEIRVWVMVRAGLMWARVERNFPPGPGGNAQGYLVTRDVEATAAAPALDLGELWDF